MSISHYLRETRYLVEFVFLWPVLFLLRCLSDEQSRTLARGMSRLFYRLITFDRQWCLKNLELVYGPNLTPAQRSRLAMKSFENNALTLMEALRWTPEWMAAQVNEDGWQQTHQIIRETAQQGKGFIIISAHLGNFELLSACSCFHGEKVTVLYRPQKNWRLDRLLVGARAGYMPQTLPRGPWGLIKLRGALRRGEGIGLAIDQNTPENPLFVDFLGIPAASPSGAAFLALATGAPVMLAVSLRLPEGRHRLLFHPPFELIRTGDRERDIRLNTEQYMRAIETYVRAYPEQYNWQHPRWRYRPDGTNWEWHMPTEKLAAARTGPPLPFEPVQSEQPVHLQVA